MMSGALPLYLRLNQKVRDMTQIFNFFAASAALTGQGLQKKVCDITQ
jgi:hypothetical protein